MIFLRNLHQHTVTSVSKKPFHQQQTNYRTAKNYSNTHIDDDQWSKLTFVMEPLQQLTREQRRQNYIWLAWSQQVYGHELSIYTHQISNPRMPRGAPV